MTLGSTLLEGARSFSEGRRNGASSPARGTREEKAAIDNNNAGDEEAKDATGQSSMATKNFSQLTTVELQALFKERGVDPNNFEIDFDFDNDDDDDDDDDQAILRTTVVAGDASGPCQGLLAVKFQEAESVENGGTFRWSVQEGMPEKGVDIAAKGPERPLATSLRSLPAFLRRIPMWQLDMSHHSVATSATSMSPEHSPACSSRRQFFPEEAKLPSPGNQSCHEAGQMLPTLTLQNGSRPWVSQPSREEKMPWKAWKQQSPAIRLQNASSHWVSYHVLQEDKMSTKAVERNVTDTLVASLNATVTDGAGGRVEGSTSAAVNTKQEGIPYPLVADYRIRPYSWPGDSDHDMVGTTIPFPEGCKQLRVFAFVRGKEAWVPYRNKVYTRKRRTIHVITAVDEQLDGYYLAQEHELVPRVQARLGTDVSSRGSEQAGVSRGIGEPIVRTRFPKCRMVSWILSRGLPCAKDRLDTSQHSVGASSNMSQSSHEEKMPRKAWKQQSPAIRLQNASSHWVSYHVLQEDKMSTKAVERNVTDTVLASLNATVADGAGGRVEGSTSAAVNTKQEGIPYPLVADYRIRPYSWPGDSDHDMVGTTIPFPEGCKELRVFAFVRGKEAWVPYRNKVYTRKRRTIHVITAVDEQLDGYYLAQDSVDTDHQES
eukprot:g12775.t1